ncbi:MAG: hypothetical protein ABI629_01340 [bacterium]
MTDPTGKEAVLSAFDRLFDRAATKLNLTCSDDERAEAKKYFTDRYADALELLDKADFPPIAQPSMTRMEQAIDGLSPAFVAAHLASGPLALHVQEFMRQIALRAAEQRLVEHMTRQADNVYGGN